MDSGEQGIVGVNKYIAAEEQEPRILEIDETVEKKLTERLAQVKRERDNDRVKQALAEVRRVAATNENVMPTLIEAVKTYATVGEISDALRAVFGEYREPGVI